LCERLRNLLSDRFGLKTHEEQREMRAYVLSVAKGGPKLQEPPPGEPFKLHLSRGRIANEGGATISMLVNVLSNQLDSPLFDETALNGHYRMELKWTPDSLNPSGVIGPSLFTALQEQLGLKLDAKRRPVKILVVDRVERPSEN